MISVTKQYDLKDIVLMHDAEGHIQLWIKVNSDYILVKTCTTKVQDLINEGNGGASK